MTTVEEWRPVPDFEEFYAVSNLGRIRRLARHNVKRFGRPASLPERLLNPVGGKRDQYLNFTAIGKDGYRKQLKVHRCVASAFLTPDQDPLRNHVNHKNCDRTDNRLENLEWVTPFENHLHAKGMGRQTTSEPGSNSQCKLTIEQVEQIRATYRKRGRGMTSGAVLAALYGVSDATISYIVNSKTYVLKSQNKV